MRPIFRSVGIAYSTPRLETQNNPAIVQRQLRNLSIQRL